MKWRDAQREGMFAAADAHDALRLDVTQRVDVYSALTRLDIAVMARPLRGVAGLFIPSSGDRGAGVLISSLHPPARQRFTAAHELGHHWLGHEASLDVGIELFARTGTKGSLPADEMIAESFASWFLMPTEAVERTLEALNRPHASTPADVYAVSLRLGTSYLATTHHMKTLGLVDPHVSRGWEKVAPRRIKAMLSKDACLPASRQDVWALSSLDHGRTLQVRAGDRFVVTLPEVEGAGWEPVDKPGEALRAVRAVPEGRPELFPEPRAFRSFVLDLDPEAAGIVELRFRRRLAEEYIVHLAVEQPLLGPVGSKP